MALFLIIREGENADESQAILATADPLIIDCVVDGLIHRFFKKYPANRVISLKNAVKARERLKSLAASVTETAKSRQDY